MPCPSQPADDDTAQPAEKTNPSGFAQKDRQHIAIGRAHGFHQADLARPLQDGHCHRIGNANRSDQQGDRADTAKDELQDHIKIVDPLHKGLRRERLKTHVE